MQQNYKIIFLPLLSILLTACAVPVPLNYNQPLKQPENCLLKLEDNRMNQGMLDQKGDSTTVMGYLKNPLKTTPDIESTILSHLCAIEEIAAKPISFELEKFYCDWKGRLTYAVGVFELELSYLDKQQKRKYIHSKQRVNYEEDLSLHDICGGAISKTFLELPNTLRQQFDY